MSKEKESKHVGVLSYSMLGMLYSHAIHVWFRSKNVLIKPRSPTSYVFFDFNFLHSHPGNQAAVSTAHKWNPIINHPQYTTYRRENNGGDMIYGKTHRDAGCYITGVRDLLEIGLDGDMEIVKNLVQNI